MKITANEVYVMEFGAIIRTRCPQDKVTDAMIHERVLAANLAAGDFVKVQCFNHDKTAVLHYAEYMVYDRTPSIKRVEISDRETRSAEHVAFSVVRTVEWTATPSAPKEETEDAGLTAKWNPGKKVFEVLDGDKVLASFTKEDGGKDAALAYIEQDGKSEAA